MSFKRQEAVLRAGGIHGAVATIDWGNMGPVYLDQETEGIEPVIYLLPGDFPRTILIPGPFEGRSVYESGQAEKSYQ